MGVCLDGRMGCVSPHRDVPHPRCPPAASPPPHVPPQISLSQWAAEGGPGAGSRRGRLFFVNERRGGRDCSAQGPRSAQGSAQRSAAGRGCGERSGRGTGMGPRAPALEPRSAEPSRATYAVAMSGGASPAPAPGSRRFVCVGVSRGDIPPASPPRVLRAPLRLRASRPAARPGPRARSASRWHPPPPPPRNAPHPRPGRSEHPRPPVQRSAPAAWLLPGLLAMSAPRSGCAERPRPLRKAPLPLLPGRSPCGAPQPPPALPAPLAVPRTPDAGAPSTPGPIAKPRRGSRCPAARPGRAAAPLGAPLPHRLPPRPAQPRLLPRGHPGPGCPPGPGGSRLIFAGCCRFGVVPPGFGGFHPLARCGMEDF